MTETKKPSPAFQFYPLDFMAMTASDSPEERGVFITLICYCWSHRRLPTDAERLRRVASGISVQHWDTIWEYLRGRFRLVDGGWESPWLEEIRERQSKYLDSQREKATKGAHARWHARGHNPGMARASSGQCPTDASSSSSSGKDRATVVSKDTTSDAAHRAAPANKPVTGRQRPDVRAFLAHFASRYASVVGTPYVPQGADGKQAAAILDALSDHADIKARLERFLTSDDPFIAQAARTVATFRACLNKPCILATQPEPVKSPEALWAVASACLSKYGSNRFQEAYEAAGEPVASIVRKAGGWKALGAATEFDARRLFLASVNGHAK